MKKNILIVARKMDMGGVEVSLLGFLKNIDYLRYRVTLLLEKREGALVEEIPENVRIITPVFRSNVDFKCIELSTKLNIWEEIQFKIVARKCKKDIESDNAFFSYVLNHVTLEDSIMEYDLAIDYHGYGHFLGVFMANKIKAKKYIMFIHDERLNWLKNVRSVLPKYAGFFCVSKRSKNRIEELYPDAKRKTFLFYNIVDKDKIFNKANEVQSEIPDGRNNVIVSVGRLEEEKGFDVAISAAEILNQNGVDFCWYIVGNGSKHLELQGMINAKGIADKVFLLGEKKNPYPYIKRADIYVQPSRYEGYVLTVCEARILKKVIVASNLESIREQVISGVNASLVEISPNEFSKEIERLLNSPEIRRQYVNELSLERIDYSEQMKLIDKMVGELNE